MQKNKILFLFIIINILFGVLSVSSASGKSAISCDKLPTHLSGSLLQPDITTEWSLEKWKAEFRLMKDACLSQIIIQWTADSRNKNTFYPTKLDGYSQLPNVDILDKVFTAAQTEGIDVYLGLQKNDEWFPHNDKTGKFVPGKYANDRDWLNNEASESINIANEIWVKYGNYPGFKSHFKGWYSWFEFDNVNFPPPPSKSFENMSSYYQTVGDSLHKLTPEGTFVISPFYNLEEDKMQETAPPSEALQNAAKSWKQMLVSILSNSPIDILALQDSTGAKEARKNPHSSTAQLPIMFEATQKAIAESGKKIQLWSNPETYVENLEGMKEGEREPMTIGTMVKNMNTVKPYVTNYISFSFNHYLSPQQGHTAFYNAYRNYLEKGLIETRSPAAPTSLKSVFVTPQGVKFNWNPGAADSELAGYKIYRNNELIRVLFVSNPNNEMSYSDIDDPANNPLFPDNYIYNVVAFNAAGKDSVKSESLPVTIPEFQTNSAFQKSYRVKVSADASYPDPGCQDSNRLICRTGLLTDGKPNLLTDPIDYRQWQGRNTESKYSFIIDLESEQTISEINSDWLQVEKDFIFLPKQITYSISTDNINFEVAGTIDKPSSNNSNQTYRYQKTQINKIGRYVKIEVKPEKFWSFVAEAEVVTN